MTDEERFTALFAEHYGQVLAYAQRRVGIDAADDLVAEVFTTAWRHLDRIPSTPLPWLYRAAWNAIGNHRRSLSRHARLTGRLGSEATRVSPGRDPAGVSIDAGPVIAALAKLSDLDRETIRLLCWEQLTTTEAAAVLGCSQTALKVRLHRARRRLSALLDDPAQSPSSVELPSHLESYT